MPPARRRYDPLVELRDAVERADASCAAASDDPLVVANSYTALLALLHKHVTEVTAERGRPRRRRPRRR